MRIGLDARFYGREGKGLGRYTERLIAHLAEQNTNHEFVVFLRRPEFDSFSPPPGFRKVLADVSWYSVREQRTMPGILGREHLDLMHFPHFNIPVLYRGPFIVTIHDLILLHFPTVRASTRSAPFYWTKHALYRGVLARAVHGAKHLITVSEFSKNDLVQSFQLDPSRITVTYEAADPLPEPQAPALSSKLRAGFYLTVGNAYPHKNLDGLIAALAPAWKAGRLTKPLVLVGRRDYFYDQLSALVRRLQLEDHVLFAGAVKDAELSWLYHHATAYCFPSRYEGFGLPGLEAMRAGCPVVASTAASLPEVYGGAALYADPGDPSAWVNALVRLENDSQIRSEHIRRGRERVAAFSWTRLAQETLKVYEACR